MYGVSSGWGNQLISLQHGLWLSNLTGRTLVLPPVLDHFMKGMTNLVTGDKSLPQIFDDLDHQPKMSTVLNFSWSSVPVIDYTDFKQSYMHSLPAVDHNRTSQYTNCKTTTFTADLAKHGVNEYEMNCGGSAHHMRQYPHDFNHSTLLHPVLLPEHKSEQLWMLDFIFPWGLFDETILNSHPMPVVYSEVIRDAAMKLLQKWAPVIAVHIRGGDGPYKNRNWDNYFPNIMGKFSKITESSSASNFTVLILTDIEEIAYKVEGAPLYQKWLLSKPDNLQVDFVSVIDYLDVVRELMPTYGGEAGVYLDMELGSSAPYFIRSPGSTYNAWIEVMRMWKINGKSITWKKFYN